MAETKDCVFTPLAIGNLKVKNRMIVTAMHTGFPIEQETRFLARRGEGGAGALTATMGVSENGSPHNMTLLSEKIVPKLRYMADAIHATGSNLFIQLFHAGRNGNTGGFANPAMGPVAPSPIASTIYKEVPRELTTSEIKAIVEEYGHAAQICKHSGVDAVEISCSAGYLLSQFISTITNIRQDQYGGTLENRLRFPMEVIRKVRAEVGPEYPVILRVSGSDMIGGYGIKETIEFVREAETYIDALNVTGGWHESNIPQISMHVPLGGFAIFAREIRNNVAIPVIACNRINNLETAKELITNGYCDFVGCCRAFLVDDSFGNKAQSGKKYRRCIGCNTCIEHVLRGEQVVCTFNPFVGKEASIRSNSTNAPQKILIVGGGPSGMQAALQYANAGHRVTLCTNEDRLGGLLRAGAKIPHKSDMESNIQAMEQELEDASVEIRRNTTVDGIYINKNSPDIVIIATGSQPIIPRIKGIQLENVHTAHSILMANDSMIDCISSRRILIVGGGAVGLETALFLINKAKIEQQSIQFFDFYKDSSNASGLICNSNITIVEMGEKIGQGLKSTRWITLKELKHYNAKLLTCTEVIEIKNKEVVVKNRDETYILEMDHVILAAGYQLEDSSLIEWLEANKYIYHVIGDANKVGTIESALIDASELPVIIN